MFLNEIDKNEFEYLEKLKNYAIETFVKFYGEEYRGFIEEKLESTPIICYDRKGVDESFALNKIDNEKNLLLKEWFFSVFNQKDIRNAENLTNKIDTIKEEIDFCIDESELIETINNILNEEIFKTENIDYSSQIETLLKNYKFNFKNDFDTLLFFELDILENGDKTVDRFETFYDLEQSNKYVKRISDKLNESQKISLLNSSNFFINRDISRGLFYTDSDEYSHNEFVAFPQLKIVDINLFLHELNHVISYNFKKEKNYNILSNGTWTRKRNLKTNQVEEKYNFLNEVITDYFVYKMDLKNLENKKLLFSSTTKSSYSLSFVLLEPFMDKYFHIVKECYITSDIDKLEKLFGAYNLEAFDHLLKDFSGYAKTMQSVAYLTTDFEDGLHEAKRMEDARVPSYVTKYYNSFIKMQFLMENIERYQKNNDLELDY